MSATSPLKENTNEEELKTEEELDEDSEKLFEEKKINLVEIFVVEHLKIKKVKVNIRIGIN